MKINTPCLILLACLVSHVTYAQEREIAITIDDLPFVGTDSNDSGNLKRSHDRFMRILDSLVSNQVPATGFVIAGSIGKGQWELLEAFRKEGFGLGNHTYSHPSLNKIPSSKYIDEIARADKILQPVMTQPKYFRYPYLAEGRGATRQEIQDYLSANQYVIAPVTIDSKDYQFNERLLKISWRIRNQYINQIKQQYLAYIWNQTLKAEKHSKDANAKQILLLHSNLLNSYCLSDVIQMYKKNGYKFISLDAALTNTAPTITVSEPKVAPEVTTNPQDQSKKTKPEQSAINDSDSFKGLSSYQNYSNTEWLSDWEKGW